MRSWVSAYSYVRARSQLGWEVAIAALPGGSGGQRGTLGGVAIGVSRYAANRDLAILAIKSLTSEASQIRNAEITGTIPTRTTLSHRPDIMAHTPLHGQLGAEVLSGIVARPSLLAGTKYDAVSRAYFEAVHSVLTRRATAEDAMAHLETELVRITGFRAVRD